MVAADPRYNLKAWRRLSAAVIDRDRGVCQIQGPGCTRGATGTDHIVSPIEGGDFWDPHNLRASCKHCNSVRGARLMNQRQARYAASTAPYMTRW